jgi:hypothetical protein
MVEASYPGDSNFASSTSATVTLAGVTAPVVTVTPSSTSITTAQSLNVSITVSGSPTPTGTVVLTGGGYTSATIALANGSATFIVSAGSLAIGSDILTASYTPDSPSLSTYNSATGTGSAVTVTQAKTTPGISWATPAAVTYGTSLSATQLNASSGGVAGNFAYTPASGTVLDAGKQTLSVTFTPTDTTDYNTATTTVTLTVNQETPTISWTTPAAVTYGTSLSANQLNASSGGVAGNFAYTPASGTVLGVGKQTLSVTFTPTDTTDYNTATATVTLTVNQATQTIAWAAPAAVTYGTALSATQLNASSGGVAGNFAYTPASGTVLGAGKQTLSVTFTPTDTADYNTVTATVTLTVNQATPTISWATPAGITFGTELSATQLDAIASVSGTLTYNPAAGTTPAVGSDTLSVLFTPSDTTDYTTATATVMLAVSSPLNPLPSLNSMSPAFSSAGGSAFTLTLTGTGFVSGSTVYWGTTALSTQFTSSTQLTAQVTAAEISNAGMTAVSVQSPAPGGGTSNALQFEVDSAGGGSGIAPAFTTMTASVTAGVTASYPVTLSSSATDVSVTCLNLPAGATCSYSSTTGAVTIATSSTTPKGTYQITVVFTGSLPGSATAFVVLPLLLLPLLVMRRRLVKRNIWFTASLALVILAGVATAVGCGGSGSTPVSPTNPTHQATSSGGVTLTIQ